MDLEALKEILDQISGGAGFERGRNYSVEITEEEAKRILGELPLPGAILAVKVRIMENSDSQYLSLVRKLQFLPGGKDKPHKK
jgi:hypothetical protein